MRIINTALSNALTERVMAERKQRHAEQRVRALAKRPRNQSPPKQHEYQLMNGPEATGTIQMMTFQEAAQINLALRQKFIRHVNECIDAKTSVTERLQTWKIHRHATELEVEVA